MLSRLPRLPRPAPMPGRWAITAPPPPSALPGYVSALSPGDWYAVPGTNISSIEPNPLPSGTGTPNGKIDAWTSMVVDTRDSSVWAVAGGGHADYSGNEAGRIALADESPAWAQRRAPTLTVSNANYYADGRPTSRHHYYGVAMDETAGRVMLFGGSRYSDGGILSVVDSYDIATDDYNPAATHPNFPATVSAQEIKAICRDPRNGDVYVFANFNVAKWTRSTNTWSSPISGQTGSYAQSTASAFDTMRNRILCVGDSRRFTYDPADPGVTTSVTLTGTDISAATGMGMVYVELIDAYLVRQAASGGLVYRIDAGTFAVTTFTTTGGTTIPATLNGPYNKFLYVPGLQGCIYFPTYTGNGWFLRVH